MRCTTTSWQGKKRFVFQLRVLEGVSFLEFSVRGRTCWHWQVFMDPNPGLLRPRCFVGRGLPWTQGAGRTWGTAAELDNKADATTKYYLCCLCWRCFCMKFCWVADLDRGPLVQINARICDDCCNDDPCLFSAWKICSEVSYHNRKQCTVTELSLGPDGIAHDEIRANPPQLIAGSACCTCSIPNILLLISLCLDRAVWICMDLGSDWFLHRARVVRIRFTSSTFVSA